MLHSQAGAGGQSAGGGGREQRLLGEQGCEEQLRHWPWCWVETGVGATGAASPLNLVLESKMRGFPPQVKATFLPKLKPQYQHTMSQYFLHAIDCYDIQIWACKLVTILALVLSGFKCFQKCCFSYVTVHYCSIRFCFVIIMIYLFCFTEQTPTKN